jgi:membrane protease subunit HflC
MSNKGLLSLAGLVVIGLVVYSSIFVVTERERAVMLEFGRMIQTDLSPGLHFKKPWATVRKFDGRLLTADMEKASFYTVENKRLIVDSYIKWRIVDAEAYYKATGGIEALAVDRLAQRAADGLRNQFGRRTLHDVVSGKRDELMREITESANKDAGVLIGAEIIDIRVKRVDLPDEVSRSVYARMAADREKEAREYRSQGKEQAEVISADADKQRAILEANAFRDAERIRGEGDAKATAIYAEAFTQDAEFYSFVRSINAYKSSFAGKEDLMVVDPNSDFFRYFKDAKGGK